MSTIQPPAFPARLLKRLVPAQDHDVLLGDLCEEYQRGRSKVWYWLQILAAVIVESWKDIRTYTGVALSAVALGTALQFGLWAFLNKSQYELRHSSALLLWNINYHLIFTVIDTSGPIVVGWIVARLYRSHGITSLLAYRAALLSIMLVVFLWYYVLFALRMDARLLLSLSHQLRSGITNHVIQSVLTLTGGYLATRRVETA
jgi:hypothetical protein